MEIDAHARGAYLSKQLVKTRPYSVTHPAESYGGSRKVTGQSYGFPVQYQRRNRDMPKNPNSTLTRAYERAGTHTVMHTRLHGYTVTFIHSYLRIYNNNKGIPTFFAVTGAVTGRNPKAPHA
jgi:hypothetical protein